MRKTLIAIALVTAFTAIADDYPIKAGIPHDPNGQKYVEVYAHRGDRTFSPENTIPAYATGLAVGTDWADMDFGITKDGVLLVDHDYWLNPDIVSVNGNFWAPSKKDFINTLNSMPGGFETNVLPYLVHNMTLEQLQKYEVGIINPTSQYAKYFPQQRAVPGTRLPTLQEVIDYVNKVTNKEVKFQIEIKNDPVHPQWTATPREFAEKINEFLIKNDLVDKAEIQSFDWEPLYILHEINPKVKTAFLIGADGIQRMYTADPKVAGLWSDGKLVKDYNNSIPQMVKALGGACYEPEDFALTKADLDECHKLGIKVCVWRSPEDAGNEFDPVLINRLIDWGVDGIIIDDPARLNSILASRGMRNPKTFQVNNK